MWTPATYVVSPRYLNCGPLLYTWTLLHGEWTRAINEPLLRDLYYLRTTSVTSATCGVWTSTTYFWTSVTFEPLHVEALPVRGRSGPLGVH